MRSSLRRYALSCGLLALLVASLPASALAVPASPKLSDLRQPTGDTFKARQWGDERAHGWQTARGTTVVFDKAVNRWTYAKRSSSGALITSGRVVGEDGPPSGVARQQLRPMITLAEDSYRLTRELRPRGSGTQGGGSLPRLQVVPAVGTGLVPVFLVNFTDTTTTYTAANFQTKLFGTGNFSMRDYFNEVSYNRFTVSSGPGGVGGWYTASNTHNYYGANNGAKRDLRPGHLVRETIAAADAAGFNFAPYDLDGDCYVDVVNIVHQGTDEASGGVTTDIWSHRWNLNSANASGFSSGGEWTSNDPCPSGGSIKVNDYVTEAERQTTGQQETVGVFAHEYSHALGLPDLYDTDYTSWGIGNWSLMAFGSYNQVTLPGDRPAHLDAWSKYRVGWAVPRTVGAGLYNEPISAAATAADTYKLRAGGPTSGEYFLVENRQKTGFDAGLPGAGLLIWHIDGPDLGGGAMAPNDDECFPGGTACSVQHFAVRLIQADNGYDLEKKLDKGDTGDVFPGSAAKTSWTNTSTPNSRLYSGANSNVGINNISASAATMTATMATALPPTPSPVSATALNSGIISLTYKDTSSNESGFKIERKVGTCASANAWAQVMTSALNTSIWTNILLSSNTYYSYRMRAYNAVGESGYSTCTYARTGAAGTPSAPNNVVADSTGLATVNVRWSDIANNETNYRVYRRVGIGGWAQIGQTGANATSYSNGNAGGNTTNTTYTYMVAACNAAGCSPYTVQAIVPFAPAVPGASTATPRQITFTWSDRSANETGFYIYRKSGNCASANAWTNIASAYANTTSWVNSGLLAGNVYAYKVRATYRAFPHPTAWGLSYYSPCVSATVQS